MPPLAHYKLNGDANDASGNGNHGTPTDITYPNSKPGLRQAALFNGSSSKIRVASEILPLGLGPWTLATWINLSVIYANDGLFNNGTGTAAGVRTSWLFFADNRMRINIGDGTSYLAIYSTAGASLSGSWKHLAVTRAADGYINFYLNGQPHGGGANTKSVPDGYGSSEIGRNYFSNSFIISGLLDDFRVYAEALPLWMIKDIFNFGRGSEECEPWQRLIRPTIQPVINDQ